MTDSLFVGVAVPVVIFSTTAVVLCLEGSDGATLLGMAGVAPEDGDGGILIVPLIVSDAEDDGEAGARDNDRDGVAGLLVP